MKISLYSCCHEQKLQSFSVLDCVNDCSFSVAYIGKERTKLLGT
jgi:hypothetical protein